MSLDIYLLHLLPLFSTGTLVYYGPRVRLSHLPSDIWIFLHYPLDTIKRPISSTCLLCTITCVLSSLVLDCWFGWVCQDLWILDISLLRCLCCWALFPTYSFLSNIGTWKVFHVGFGRRPKFASVCQTWEDACVECFLFSECTFAFHNFFDRPVLPTTSNSFVNFQFPHMVTGWYYLS